MCRHSRAAPGIRHRLRAVREQGCGRAAVGSGAVLGAARLRCRFSSEQTDSRSLNSEIPFPDRERTWSCEPASKKAKVAAVSESKPSSPLFAILFCRYSPVCLPLTAAAPQHAQVALAAALQPCAAALVSGYKPPVPAAVVVAWSASPAAEGARSSVASRPALNWHSRRTTLCRPISTSRRVLCRRGCRP
jgi:hypothetical protein